MPTRGSTIGSSFNELASQIRYRGAKKATVYISPTETIKATRRGKVNGRAKTMEILFTIGKPNYKEREFIKKCKKAGEPFPIKKVQLKFDKGE